MTSLCYTPCIIRRVFGEANRAQGSIPGLVEWKVDSILILIARDIKLAVGGCVRTTHCPKAANMGHGTEAILGVRRGKKVQVHQS